MTACSAVTRYEWAALRLRGLGRRIGQIRRSRRVFLLVTNLHVFREEQEVCVTRKKTINIESV